MEINAHDELKEWADAIYRALINPTDLIRRAIAEHEQSQKCCAEMREALEMCEDHIKIFSDATPLMVRHSLSSSCGKNFATPEQVRVLKEALEMWRSYFQSDIPKNRDEAQQQVEDFTNAWFATSQALDLCNSILNQTTK